MDLETYKCIGIYDIGPFTEYYIADILPILPMFEMRFSALHITYWNLFHYVDFEWLIAIKQVLKICIYLESYYVEFEVEHGNITKNRYSFYVKKFEYCQVFQDAYFNVKYPLDLVESHTLKK